jgi:ribonuclease-3
MNRRLTAIADLETRLGHVFADRDLLEQALTHASVRAGGGARGLSDNERLEFLGDRVLGLVIADHLVALDPAAGAGDLTKRFHGLVSGEACARVARSLGLGEALRLPGGESRRGARDHETIVADACEAIIAALYLELGLPGAAAIVLTLWGPLLAEPHDPAAANPKSELQEWAAAQGKAAPVYRVLARAGPDHAPTFTLEVSIDGADPVIAQAGSVRAAEKAAALGLLRRARGEV